MQRLRRSPRNKRPAGRRAGLSARLLLPSLTPAAASAPTPSRCCIARRSARKPPARHSRNGAQPARKPRRHLTALPHRAPTKSSVFTAIAYAPSPSAVVSASRCATHCIWITSIALSAASVLTRATATFSAPACSAAARKSATACVGVLLPASSISCPPPLLLPCCGRTGPGWRDARGARLSAAHHEAERHSEEQRFPLSAFLVRTSCCLLAAGKHAPAGGERGCASRLSATRKGFTARSSARPLPPRLARSAPAVHAARRRRPGRRLGAPWH